MDLILTDNDHDGLELELTISNGVELWLSYDLLRQQHGTLVDCGNSGLFFFVSFIRSFTDVRRSLILLLFSLP